MKGRLKDGSRVPQAQEHSRPALSVGKRVTKQRKASVEPVRRLVVSQEERDKTGLFYTEGMRFVTEAAMAGVRGIESLIIAPELMTHPYSETLLRSLEERAVPIIEVSGDIFRSLSLVEEPQGIGAVVHQRWERLHRAQRIQGLCWVALDTIRSPGNLGTIIRTCEAVGAAGLILVGEEIDPYAPLVVRATMGALFGLHFARVPNRAALKDWARESGALLVGTSPHAVDDYQALRYPAGGTILWLGGERLGMSEEQQAVCNHVVRIPMNGRADSLNVAVAAGVLLYEVYNQSRVGR